MDICIDCRKAGFWELDEIEQYERIGYRRVYNDDYDNSTDRWVFSAGKWENV